MAPPTDKKVGPFALGLDGSPKDEVRDQLNNVIDTLRLLTAKLDLDVGVTDTNYKALLTESGVATAPAKVVP